MHENKCINEKLSSIVVFCETDYRLHRPLSRRGWRAMWYYSGFLERERAKDVLHIFTDIHFLLIANK